MMIVFSLIHAILNGELSHMAKDEPMEAVIKSDNALRVAGMKLLIEGLGSVNAERFINCLKKDSFDYTEWQRDFWKGKTIEEVYQAAADFYAKGHG